MAAAALTIMATMVGQQTVLLMLQVFLITLEHLEEVVIMVEQ